MTKLPRIARHDYEAIRNLLKHELPGTYEEWLQLRQKWLDQYPIVSNVDVDPDKFSRFLASAGHPSDLKALLVFIEEESK